MNGMDFDVEILENCRQAVDLPRAERRARLAAELAVLGQAARRASTAPSASGRPVGSFAPLANRLWIAWRSLARSRRQTS